jgi:hypothetical protein
MRPPQRVRVQRQEGEEALRAARDGDLPSVAREREPVEQAHACIHEFFIFAC